MLFLKFLLGIFIVLFCIFLGYFASEKYRLKKSFFTQLFELNEKYLAELKFEKKPLEQFLNAQTFSGDFDTLIKGLLKGQIVLKGAYLNEDEKGEIGEYFTMFGRGDSRSQSGYFSAKSKELSQKKEECVKNAKSYTDLYLKLGLLLGLAVIILIV